LPRAETHALAQHWHKHTNKHTNKRKQARGPTQTQTLASTHTSAVNVSLGQPKPDDVLAPYTTPLI
ncbi:MAG: hypothetical protein ACRC22_01730, partial [Shewanella sp.]